MDLSHQDSNARAAIQKLARSYALTEHQIHQFVLYLTMLQDWNNKINLTAITSTEDIVSLHFDDSLQLSKCMDLKSIRMLADVGTGAGFPGLALKIMFPDLPVLLIEVVQKKIEFLDAVITACNLQGVEISGADWRNFLRVKDFDIDLFVSRAALPPEELLRAFKPACGYKEAQIVYWASKTWQPATKEEVAYKQKEYHYTVDGKSRKLIFFKRNSAL